MPRAAPRRSSGWSMGSYSVEFHPPLRKKGDKSGMAHKVAARLDVPCGARFAKGTNKMSGGVLLTSYRQRFCCADSSGLMADVVCT